MRWEGETAAAIQEPFLGGGNRQGVGLEDDASQDGTSELGRHRHEQAQIMARQDEALTELSTSAQRLTHTALAINTELRDQTRMLEELDSDIERETENLNFVMRRLGRLMRTGDSKQLCLIVGLFVLLVVLVFLVINV
mmetsp:Transcript_30777/g.65476  ORF Transcript_30777/g.65476 Transcript_30777/m.65476 type:complete len:138 (-) Transcript_30777:87-500(-)